MVYFIQVIVFSFFKSKEGSTALHTSVRFEMCWFGQIDITVQIGKILGSAAILRAPHRCEQGSPAHVRPPEFNAKEVKLRVGRRTFAFLGSSVTRRVRPTGSYF